MRLLALRLHNFRQHVDTSVTFAPGLTGIIGPNGAGKSTLLEAIAWSIYGSEAVRGTNDTLRFSRAGPRSRVEVELEFALGGRAYRVLRTLGSAEVYLDGGISPVATTVGGVSRYLQGRLGMSRREFFNTYYTGQKELHFLAAMGATERGQFLSRVLGYEKLRVAQELARQGRKKLRHEIDAIRSGLRDEAEVRGEREAAEHARVEAAQRLLSARVAAEAARAEQEALGPRWAEAQQARERHAELTHALATAEHDREAAGRELTRIDAELDRIDAAAAERASLDERLVGLPALLETCARLDSESLQNERRKAIAGRVVELEAEVARARERLGRLEAAPALLARYAAELEALGAEVSRLGGEIEERKTAWLRDRQDAETKLQGYRERGSELLEQIGRIRQAGAEGKCPTCGRPLGADFERTLDELDEQWGLVVQDGKWWKSRFEQLEGRPDDLREMEERLQELERAVGEKSRKHVRCEAAIGEMEATRAELAQRSARMAQLQEELRRLPAEYDAAGHRAAEASLNELRTLQTRAARLDEIATRAEGWKRERAEAVARLDEASRRSTASAAAREALDFSEEEFVAARTAHELASERSHAAQLDVAGARGDLANAETAAAASARTHEQLLERLRDIAAREDEDRHHKELDAALSRLRTELNARVRPELSDIASLFLAQLTDGRYTSLEIDEHYNICVLDEGEEKPVISGGEEDVANLVLRLSLSQMIAERAGYPLSLLILDEVFGSLDVARRDNVVQLLRRLESRFEQVILTTHVDGLRESLDQVLHVSYDERTGSSIVRQQSFHEPRPENRDVAAD
jgi:DNA repair protein SbcC/Rad50